MSAIGKLLMSIRRLHEITPELQDYATWPDDLSEQKVIAESCPAAATLGVRSLRGTRATAPVIKALRAVAPLMKWKQTYDEEEVGREFLNAYGYVELFGPDGHFRTNKLRGFIGFWGPGLTYDWHDHQAEELYFTLAGSAVFSAKGSPNIMLRPGQARAHYSQQPHMMITLDQPFLAYAVWRGAGIDGLPKMLRS